MCLNTECELFLTKLLVRIRPWIETSENCNDLMDVCCLTWNRWVVLVWIWVDHNNCCDIFTPIDRLRNEAKLWEMWSIFLETADIRIRKETQEWGSRGAFGLPLPNCINAVTKHTPKEKILPVVWIWHLFLMFKFTLIFRCILLDNQMHQKN